MSISIFNKFAHHASRGETHYESAAVVLPKSAATTPNAATTDAPSGAHASIVTPDGKPPHIPVTPIVARKLDLPNCDEDRS